MSTKTINTKLYIETFLKIRDKTGNLIPLILNRPQERLYNIIKQQKQERKPVRVIALKSRQVGFSTLTEAIFFKEAATKKFVTNGIITHIDRATTNLFDMTKLMYDCLDNSMRPSILHSNAKELLFDNEDGTGLKSKVICMTAGSKFGGRSSTFNNLHISELAWWNCDKKKTLNGLLQAVPYDPNSMVIIESTANGYDYFKELWDKAVKGENDFIPLFIGWNEMEEYQIPYDGFKLTKEEIELKRRYSLTNEQIAWRRWCIENNCGGDIELFHQEYPISPEEAFLTTGRCVFERNKILKRLEEIKEPIKIGYFSYDYQNEHVYNVHWVDDKNGCIQIYEEVKEGYPYVLGGDTAGTGEDYFTAQVLDNTTGNQVAKYRDQTTEFEYTLQIYCLGMYYNNALAGLEVNYSTYPVNKLYEIGYTNQFLRENGADNLTYKLTDKIGFNTNMATRPVIIAELVQILKESIELINDYDTLKEALTFIKNKNGRAEAEQGYHDDLIMALAIAYRIRSQQTYVIQKDNSGNLICLPFALQTKEEITESEENYMEW